MEIKSDMWVLKEVCEFYSESLNRKFDAAAL